MIEELWMQRSSRYGDLQLRKVFEECFPSGRYTDPYSSLRSHAQWAIATANHKNTTHHLYRGDQWESGLWNGSNKWTPKRIIEPIKECYCEIQIGSDIAQANFRILSGHFGSHKPRRSDLYSFSGQCPYRRIICLPMGSSTELIQWFLRYFSTKIEWLVMIFHGALSKYRLLIWWSTCVFGFRQQHIKLYRAMVPDKTLS